MRLRPKAKNIKISYFFPWATSLTFSVAKARQLPVSVPSLTSVKVDRCKADCERRLEGETTLSPETPFNASNQVVGKAVFTTCAAVSMRGFFILTLIFLLTCPSPAEAFLFKKKDYKQIFLQNALTSEKRHNNKAAFHSYEKALYYYKKDRKVIEAYAQFCERQEYFDKAQELYQKLYILTKDEKYLFKTHLSTIKNGRLSSSELNKLTKTKGLTSAQKNDLNTALIYHFSYKNDWVSVKKTCAKIPKQAIGKDVVTTCIVASEKTKDKKSALGYYLRHSELYPKDSEVTDKIISLAASLNNYPLQEKYIKKLSALNPEDHGIKYRLAGLYEKHGDWRKAAKVYEELTASGDKSKHVKTSYAYVLSELHPKKQIGKFVKYVPKPLSGYKLSEKLFYDAWKEKNYEQALIYLAQMLKSQPKNTKLLKHKVDILNSQNNYQEAIIALEELQKVKPLSSDDEKLLAFLYSKTENYPKAIEIIENQLKQHPKNKELLNLALEYSMAAKDWDKAIAYTEQLLALEPKSEKLLKSAGDLYSTKQDFTSAIRYYEELVGYYPKLEYKTALANFYMANKEFENAQAILEPLYNQYPDNLEITNAFLDSILAQQRTMDAYFVIKDRHLEDTQKGYMVLGDLDMKYKHYDSAGRNYFKALQFDPENLILQDKLAESYRAFGCLNTSEKIFRRVLAQDPENLEARLGLGSIEADRKNFERSRQIFNSILRDNPDYRPAKIAMAYSYLGNDEKFSALDILNQLPQDNETRLLKAQIYYDMNMLSDSKRILKHTTGRDAEELRYKINHDSAFMFIPNYSFLKQQLSDEFKLNYEQFGIKMAQNTKGNANVYALYNVFAYMSGAKTGLNNITHEFRGGTQARPTKKWEYKADLGVKVFEFDEGAMIVTDSWLKHYFNDKFSLKLGFYRDNLIQSYLSAVGEPVNGIFTGRVADTRTYLEYNLKLPKDFYSFGRGVYGVDYAQNLPTNQYLEGMVGLGRLLYNNPKNKWIQKVNLDAVSFNEAYQYNLLNIFNNAGVLFGGYFSPSFFTVETLNLKLEGEIKKWKLKYGISGFAGIQISESPDFTRQAWGASPYISYRVNNHIDVNAMYVYYNYAAVQRNLFMVNAVIRGFRKDAKN